MFGECLSSGLVRDQSANDKLNIALIGVWGRGTAHHGWIAQENVIALCDVDEEYVGMALKIFPKAKTYTDWRGPVRLSWYQGGAMPRSPYRGIDLEAIGHGAMFKGNKGFLIADYTKRLLIPSGRDADLSYDTPRKQEDQLPAIGEFHQNWLDACKDPSKSTCCDFEYSSHYIEQMILVLIAHQVSEPFDYDGVKGRITNNADANELLSRSYREGWTLNG